MANTVRDFGGGGGFDIGGSFKNFSSPNLDFLKFGGGGGGGGSQPAHSPSGGMAYPTMLENEMYSRAGYAKNDVGAWEKQAGPSKWGQQQLGILQSDANKELGSIRGAGRSAGVNAGNRLAMRGGVNRGANRSLGETGKNTSMWAGQRLRSGVDKTRRGIIMQDQDRMGKTSESLYGQQLQAYTSEQAYNQQLALMQQMQQQMQQNQGGGGSGPYSWVGDTLDFVGGLF